MTMPTNTSRRLPQFRLFVIGVVVLLALLGTLAWSIMRHPGPADNFELNVDTTHNYTVQPLANPTPAK